MTGHCPRIRLYEGDRLMKREVVRLVLHLPFDHHDLSDGVSRALEVYLRAVGTGLEVLSDDDLGYEPYPLDEDGWEQVRATLSPPRGRRFLDDLENPKDLHRYLKNQFERQVQMWGEHSGVSGYGFFYWARLPWRRRSEEEDEVSLVSFSWPTEYLEEHGPGRMRELALGKWPEAGDLAQGRNLPAYRELARVLEPWLYACPSERELDGATPEETRRWWRRFLDRRGEAPGAEPQLAPLPVSTTGTVLRMRLMSFLRLQWSMYCMSRYIHSSNEI